jgi:ABC-type Mn2+/Zn2+ transport system permease subunit
MRQMILIAPLIGALGALTGFCFAYRWDLPVGATAVAVMGSLYLAIAAVQHVLRASHVRGRR